MWIHFANSLHFKKFHLNVVKVSPENATWIWENCIATSLNIIAVMSSKITLVLMESAVATHSTEIVRHVLLNSFLFPQMYTLHIKQCNKTITKYRKLFLSYTTTMLFVSSILRSERSLTEPNVLSWRNKASDTISYM